MTSVRCLDCGSPIDIDPDEASAFIEAPYQA